MTLSGMSRFPRTPSAVLVGFGLLLVPIGASAQDAQYCGRGQSAEFQFGFADLKSRIGEAMGAPVSCEFPDPRGTGDVHQRTTTGLAFWRKSTNIPTFTDGWQHWGKTPDGWAEWLGDSIDPPGYERPTPGTPEKTVTPT